MTSALARLALLGVLIGHISVGEHTICFPFNRDATRALDIPKLYRVHHLTLCVDTRATGSGVYPGRAWGANRKNRVVCEGFALLDSVGNRLHFDTCGMRLEDASRALPTPAPSAPGR